MPLIVRGDVDERSARGEGCNAWPVAKKGESRRADRANEWAVSVRLNDGQVLFWCGEEAERRGQDWGQENQAFRFASQAEAERYGAECQTNSKAWEYRAVRLAQPK
jgi:hypothetical protein